MALAWNLVCFLAVASHFVWRLRKRGTYNVILAGAGLVGVIGGDFVYPVGLGVAATCELVAYFVTAPINGKRSRCVHEGGQANDE
jgi:hypothetical protein